MDQQRIERLATPRVRHLGGQRTITISRHVRDLARPTQANRKGVSSRGQRLHRVKAAGSATVHGRRPQT